ncbi:putative transcriptional regulator, PucR family [Kribbella flavida DSM 17836]|uniref:Putative transcriptional regulator, PucR family n=1 Tax=Kribbella flavida (strain DSM 17836 / JCM 10339 / NBRC 14399) TaxID=479435 RepID=D2PXJ6_KRIFD|nr:PucR family transcriptional regulator [Kribbella flavida]ADB31638.1 putative transcriptional regulator, PucR family [Kribbella flavida DSM 17836]
MAKGERNAHAARAERLQNATGALSTAAITAMDEKLPWFGKLSAQDRSWIGLVAQSGITAFVDWFRDPEAHSSMPTRMFGSAPREFTRVISLHQTVDLVRTTIEMIENTIGDLLPPADVPVVREAMQRYAREVAFAAATVYAQAAEMRGAWDARLEALVVDSVIRGEADESVRSRASALGWTGTAVSGAGGSSEVAVVVGRAQPAESGTANVADAVRHAAREAGADALCAMQGDRLVVVLGGTSKPVEIVQKLERWFGPGPIVVGPVVPDLMAAVTSARAAVAGLRAAPAWPGAPRPVQADELLPERSLSGDGHARRQLATEVYGPLTMGDGVLLDTVAAYLDSGGSIEATARVMFIHPNTVRYRLKRVGDLTGYAPGNPRDAFTLRVALALGRLLNPEPGAHVL